MSDVCLYTVFYYFSKSSLIETQLRAFASSVEDTSCKATLIGSSLCKILKIDKPYYIQLFISSYFSPLPRTLVSRYRVYNKRLISIYFCLFFSSSYPHYVDGFYTHPYWFLHHYFQV